MLLSKQQAKITDLEKDRASALDECQKINRTRERDLQVFKLQEMHIQKLEVQNAELQVQVKERDDQIGEMKNMLEKTIEVKLEYEEVIKALLAEESVRDLVLEVCLRNRQKMEASSQKNYNLLATPSVFG